MQPAVEKYLSAHQARFLEELKTFLRIPSVSADPAYRQDMHTAAAFVHEQFQQMGLDSEIVSTPGHPLVVGEWRKRPGAPTVLVYGHYDVQPPDPLELWTTPAFEPTIRDGKLFARGATDDKGQFFTHVKSLEAWLKSTGELPVNVIFVVEGEEEVGGANLDQFLNDRREQLACDVAVVSDTSQYAPGIPAITYGLRGIIACEVTLTGPKKDLHSGVFGGSVANPVNALCRIVARLHDNQGRVQVPGFYDGVQELTASEREEWRKLPFDEVAYLQELGVTEPFGEVGFTTLERRWARPTCDVNGIFGGYTGVGPKTIVPAQATAKLTCRLVPDQNPQQVMAALEQFLREQCPPGVSLKFTDFHGCPAFVFDPTSPYIAAAKIAIAEGFGAEPVLIREGGSIPVVSNFRQILGVDTLLLGWGQNTDNLHSPDEHFRIDDFQRGIAASAALWEQIAALENPRAQ